MNATPILFALLPLTAPAPASPALPPLSASTTAPADDALSYKECSQAYETLYEAKDAAGCAALWRANPHWVTVTLAADFESAFSQVETGTPTKEVEHRLQRALWGAAQATEADMPLVSDYVASVVGLDEYQRTLYRDAQKIHARATTTYEEGEYDLASTIAFEVVERSIDLGDWWGAAMAYVTLGDCHTGIGTYEDAIIAYGKARILYRELGLMQNEHTTLVALARCANALEQDVRGRLLVRAGLQLGDKLKRLVPDYDTTAPHVELLRLRALMESRLGDEDAAAATRKELTQLEATRAGD